MNRGVIIHLDNDVKILESHKRLFDQLGMEIDYLTCSTASEFDDLLRKHKLYLKSVIFDLLSTDPKVEDASKINSPFIDKVNEVFKIYNVPIFIYSGYLPAIEGVFDEYGTVYEVDKAVGPDDMYAKFKLLYNSGFIEVFSPGGILESEIKKDLHLSFTKQFTDNGQIENVIKSVLDSSEEGIDSHIRIQGIFKRIAIRSLSADLLAPIAQNDDKVNPIEHFYKRTSEVQIWTGDIWQSKGGQEYSLVLTPRCDLANNTDKIIYCNVSKLSKSIKLTGKKEDRLKRLRNHLTDNLLGKSKRYIPNTVFFPEGGMAELSDHFVSAREDFVKRNKYVVTLSDDFTNEIIGKFAYYFLRTGITTINENEFESYMMMLEQDGEK